MVERYHQVTFEVGSADRYMGAGHGVYDHRSAVATGVVDTQRDYRQLGAHPFQPQGSEVADP